MNNKELIAKAQISHEYNELRKYYNTKSMLQVVGKERDENTHSNIIAWLLDNSLEHGLGLTPISQTQKCVPETYTEDIEKSTNFYIVVTLSDTFGNVIDDIAFNAKDYNGVNTPSNNFMTFNPKNFQDGRFELSMKCEISCDASNEIKYGYYLDYSLDPGESFNIVKK